MPIEVILPRVDMDMTTGKISRWYVKDGDTVSKGAPIFEIETDKAAMEVESPGDGVIHNISAAEGIDIPVGEPVAFIYAKGEAVGTVAPASSVRRGDPKPVIGLEQPAEIANVVGSRASQGDKPRATPLARSLARKAGIEVSSVEGSGPHGRIVAADVTAALETAKAAPPPVKSLAMPDDAILSLYEAGSYERIAHSNMRRTIAHRLVQSKQTVPHFYLNGTSDVSQLLGARARLNKRGAPAWKLSVNDFIIKALALGLRDVPDANVTWTESGMLRHRSSDVSVAIAIEGGLLTPVIRAAEAKSLSVISREMKDLAARARTGKLLPSEYHGGTASISNLGMYGIEEFAAIINPPQATILAVGAVIDRPVMRDGAIVIAPQMKLTLSCDHRAVDGAVGAKLLSALKAYLEEPSLMLG
jgi:pyruvate dehydrogenase E2 component (dihydrolipoamide acetyltransferase)